MPVRERSVEMGAAPEQNFKNTRAQGLQHHASLAESCLPTVDRKFERSTVGFWAERRAPIAVVRNPFDSASSTTPIDSIEPRGGVNAGLCV